MGDGVTTLEQQAAPLTTAVEDRKGLEGLSPLEINVVKALNELGFDTALAATDEVINDKEKAELQRDLRDLGRAILVTLRGEEVAQRVLGIGSGEDVDVSPIIDLVGNIRSGKEYHRQNPIAQTYKPHHRTFLHLPGLREVQVEVDYNAGARDLLFMEKKWNFELVLNERERGTEFYREHRDELKGTIDRVNGAVKQGAVVRVQNPSPTA